MFGNGMYPAAGPGMTTVSIPGYDQGLQGGLPAVNDLGAKATAGISNNAVGSLDFSVAISGLVIAILVIYLVVKFILD